MFYSILNYEEPLFRPPSEAYSMIIQATIGCSWNKCAFCEMYSSKQFRARKEEDVFNDIKTYASHSPSERKLFLADGNAMVLSVNRLLRILDTVKKELPRVRQVSAYALPRDIRTKSIEELKSLKDAGLKILYVGIESGDDELLELINKGETYSSTRDELLKVKEAGIKISAMILNGLGGRKYSEQHAVNSAKVLNEIQPEFVSTLVLSFPYGVEHYVKKFEGVYEPMNQLDLIKEMQSFISACELKSSIFRSNHASNYLVLEGILNRDKEKLLSQIKNVLEDPANANLREEWSRGL